MNILEFKNELKEKSNNPEKLLKQYDEFRVYQEIVMKTLNEFHRICEKNEIHYQLAYGSLLGAIRDGGQIPWDYDSDVFVPFEEREKLIEALKRDLDKDYYFYCPEINEKCRHVFIRLAPKGYRTEIIHVDVFYLTGVPEDIEERKAFKQRIRVLSDRRYDKLVKIHDEIRSIRTNVEKIINKFKVLNVDTNKDHKEFVNECNKYPFLTSKHSSSADTFIELYDFETEMFLETKIIKTNFGEFRIPVRYEEILNNIYGDYKKIYPLESRIKEFTTSLSNLDYYAKIDK